MDGIEASSLTNLHLRINSGALEATRFGCLDGPIRFYFRPGERSLGHYLPQLAGNERVFTEKVRDTQGGRAYSRGVDGNTNGARGDSMVKQAGSHSTGRPEEALGERAAQACAWILITVGIVIELGHVAYGLPGPGPTWQLSVLGGVLWNLLRTLVSFFAKPVGLGFWPLMLVAAGMAVLRTGKRAALAKVKAAQHQERRGEQHAE
jgi:hypothetical protein